MALVYSERFYGPAQPGTTVTALYTVPTGHRAVVKEIAIVTDGAATCPVDVYVNSAAVRTRYVKTQVASGQFLIITCRLVLYAGDIIEANRLTVGTTCKVTINGFLFDDP